MMLGLSGRARKIVVGVVLACVVLGALFLAVLPEIVRRVAVGQASKLTGRTVTLDDVDLNLVTGHVALKGLHLAKRGVNERALEVERLDVRVDYLPLFRRDVRVTELSVVGTTVNRLNALREREEVPDGRMTEQLQRRVAAVRNTLTTSEGIAAERLVDGPAQPPASDESAEGRIEFQIEQ